LIIYIEDWLRERTVATQINDKAFEDASRADARSHFIDLFVEQTSGLRDEIARITASEEKISTLSKTISRIDKNIDKKRRILESLEIKYDENSKTTKDKLNSLVVQSDTLIKDVKDNHIAHEQTSNEISTQLNQTQGTIATLKDDMQKDFSDLNLSLQQEQQLNQKRESEKRSILDHLKNSIGTLFNAKAQNNEKLNQLEQHDKTIDTKITQLSTLPQQLEETQTTLKTLAEKDDTHIQALRKDISYISYSIDEVTKGVKKLDAIDTTNQTLQAITNQIAQLGSDILTQKDAYKESVLAINSIKDENIQTLISLKDGIEKIQHELTHDTSFIKKMGELQKFTSQKTLETHQTVTSLQSMAQAMIKALKASYQTTNQIYKKVDTTFAKIESSKESNPTELKQTINALTKYGAILQQNLKKELNDLADVKDAIHDITMQIENLDIPKKSDHVLEKEEIPITKSETGFLERIFLGKK
jgi:chromosome segregation ATPase